MNLNATFVASEEDVTAQQAQNVSAMAGLGGSAGQAVHLSEAVSNRDVLLTSPRVGNA
jgi:hypothetical protein